MIMIMMKVFLVLSPFSASLLLYCCGWVWLLLFGSLKRARCLNASRYRPLKLCDGAWRDACIALIAASSTPLVHKLRSATTGIALHRAKADVASSESSLAGVSSFQGAPSRFNLQSDELGPKGPEPQTRQHTGRRPGSTPPPAAGGRSCPPPVLGDLPGFSGCFGFRLSKTCQDFWVLVLRMTAVS